ncbi:unnamed protein product [Protopolystoma xenopodis]|uniref:Uncharacterized protein n=1 Tax=Protopolystoma xenopodis TaxID=117903 RepID=A0A3S5BAZ6_9PLAT|nr:unnamed protein product [Protopolystoma xenopodis]
MTTTMADDFGIGSDAADRRDYALAEDAGNCGWARSESCEHANRLQQEAGSFEAVVCCVQRVYRPASRRVPFERVGPRSREAVATS